MKKFFSMFAFVAALVLGVITLASCGSDDDDYSPLATHNFSFDTKLESDIASVRESEGFKEDNIALSNEIRTQFKERGLLTNLTDSQAGAFWIKFKNDELAKKQIQDIVDKLAAYYKDNTIKLTLIYLRDGKEWNRATWTTTYKK